jgi:hypothetical protein
MASVAIIVISREDLQSLGTPSAASISDVEYLSSYSWIEAAADSPTIAVPGSPALWSPRAGVQQLKKDSGLQFISENATRYPDYPVEPMFRALNITQPSFGLQSIDVVTDRNSIRKLLSFVSPSSNRKAENFTINIEIIKNTAVFVRAETAAYEIIGPYEHWGYGHEFEKAYTTSQIDDATGHYRIISYRFGGLKVIVRHETDAYVDVDGIPESSNGNRAVADHLPSMIESPSPLLNFEDSYRYKTPVGAKLSIKEEGHVVPLESTLEIKTRSAYKMDLEFDEVAPQLWISQTPKLVKAYHMSGKFEEPEVRDVVLAIKQWEDCKQSDLKKLAALIKKIIHEVKENGGKAVLRYNAMEDKLVLSKADVGRVLPEDLYSKWE